MPYPVFKEMATKQMAQLRQSPHNSLIFDHVRSIKNTMNGIDFDLYWALLDSRPMIPDAIFTISQRQNYKHVIIIPLFLAPSSTHTQEIKEMVSETAKNSHLQADITYGDTFFTVPYVRRLHQKAIHRQLTELRSKLLGPIANSDIGVVLGGHGDPFVLPLDQYGYKPGDIHSDLTVTEDAFGRELMQDIPYDALLGVNEFRKPTVTDAIAEFKKAGKKHILVIPVVFPTACFHSMWDLAMKSLGFPLAYPSSYSFTTGTDGVTIWYTSSGYADSGDGALFFREGMNYILQDAIVKVKLKQGSDL